MALAVVLGMLGGLVASVGDSCLGRADGILSARPRVAHFFSRLAGRSPDQFLGIRYHQPQIFHKLVGRNFLFHRRLHDLFH